MLAARLFFWARNLRNGEMSMSLQEGRTEQFKKISAEVTTQFYQQMNDKAHELKISKSELIRRALLNEINRK